MKKCGWVVFLRKFILVLLSLSLSIFISCSSRTINVGINAWPPCEIWYVSKYLKLPEDEGIEIKIVRYPTWRSSVESFYEGNLDVVHSSYFNTVYYCDKGSRGRIGIVADRALGVDGIVVSKGVKDIPSLKGKRIGVEVGTDEYFLLYKMLQNHEIKFNDVKIISIASHSAPTYLKEKRVDAVVTYEPYLSESARYGRVVETTMQYPDVIVDVIMFSDYISNRRAMVKKVRGIWFKTIEWILQNEENFDEACNIMAEKENVDAETFKVLFRGFHFFSESDNKLILNKGGRVRSVLKNIKDFLIENDIIKEKCNLNGLFLKE